MAPYKPISVKTQPTEEQFWKFVQERYSIWKLRNVKKKSPPWTDDEILKNYHFCNVFRQHDRGTQWIIKNVINKESVKSLTLFRVIAYRCCNRISTFEKYGFPEMRKVDVISWIRSLKNSPHQVFGSAYRAMSFGPTPRLTHYINALRSVLDLMEDTLFKQIPYMTSKKAIWEQFCRIRGVGPFIANEITLDLMESTTFFSGEVVEDFVNVGPGAMVGLQLIFGDDLTKSAAEKKIAEMKKTQKRYLPRSFPKMMMCDIQFSMCEYRKYIALSNGQGKKRKFTQH